MATRRPPPPPKTKTNPTGRAQTARGEVTRAKLLEVAHGLFIRNGFHGTSMRQIADAAGVAVGGIYNHFGDKEAIFAAVLDAYHPYHTLLPALEATEGDTVEAYVHNITTRARAEMTGIETRLLPLVFMELVEFQGRHLKQLAAKMFPALLNFMQGLTQRRGKLRPLPLPVMLRAYLGLMIGFLISEMLLKDSPVLKNADYDWYGGMVDIYLHGILEPEA